MSEACPVCGGKPISETKYISMCEAHKAVQRGNDAKLMGIPDLVYVLKAPDSDLGPLMADIRTLIRERPTESILIKVIP